MLYNGAWGTVCDNHWEDVDAKVVCHQLGFSDVGTIPKCCAAFGQGSGSVMIDQARCNGTELSLDQCRLNMGHQNCQHSRDASVICGNLTGKYVACDMMSV